MRSNAVTLGLAAAVLLIVVAVAAGRPAAEPSRPEAGLKARGAMLRAELVRRHREGASSPEPEAAAGAVKEPAPEEIVVRPARQSLAERGFVFKSMGSLVLREEKLALLRKALEGGDAGSKSRALSLLAGVRGTEAMALAVGVLESDGPSWLRLQAAGVLGELGEVAAVGPLLEASRAEDLHLRAGVGVALDRLGLPGPLQELIGTLSEMLDHPDGGRREDAVDLLSTVRTSAACGVLAKALGDRTNRRIREAAADALGQTRLPEAIPLLEGALHDDEPGVRQAAQAALALLRTAKP